MKSATHTETARAMNTLLSSNTNMSVADVARIYHVRQATVVELLKILKLVPEFQQLVDRGVLPLQFAAKWADKEPEVQRLLLEALNLVARCPNCSGSGKDAA